ncbi:cell adhesion molecule CEACAM4-like [Lissotriton helveticus]
MENSFQSWPSYTLGARTWCFLLTAFLGFGVHVSTTPISIKLVPESPMVGGEVVLTPSYDGPRYNVHWYRAAGNNLYYKNAIMAYNPEFNLTHFGYNFSSRETVYGDGSLKITNLTIRDTGSYTVEIITPSDPAQATVQLTVSV